MDSFGQQASYRPVLQCDIFCCINSFLVLTHLFETYVPLCLVVVEASELKTLRGNRSQVEESPRNSVDHKQTNKKENTKRKEIEAFESSEIKRQVEWRNIGDLEESCLYSPPIHCIMSVMSLYTSPVFMTYYDAVSQ